MKVYLRIAPFSPTLGLRVFLGFLALLAVAAVAFSEWTGTEAQRQVDVRSGNIWNAITLVAAAESDYQAAQWMSDAHQIETEAVLKRHLNSFGRFRSQAEWEEWKRLSAIVSQRFRTDRAEQVGMADHQFSGQLAALRAAVEKTDQAERARVNIEAATMRGQLWIRLLAIGVLALLAVAAHYTLLSRRGSRGVRRRRRDDVQGLSIK